MAWWRRPAKEDGPASAPDQHSSDRLERWDGVTMCFRVAMFSLHTSPLASLGRTRDAGGMNVYVRELARELGRSGIDVDIFTRRSDPNLPAIHQIADRVRLIQIEAGPVAPLPPPNSFPTSASLPAVSGALPRAPSSPTTCCTPTTGSRRRRRCPWRAPGMCPTSRCFIPSNGSKASRWRLQQGQCRLGDSYRT